MPQTLLAFLAIIVATFFALSQQRDIIETQQDIVRTELEIMANAVGTDRMQYIVSRDFDENMGASPQDASLSDLTPTSEFGTADVCNPIDVCEYVEDFHGDSVDDTYFVVEKAGGKDSLRFRVRTTVSYLDDDEKKTNASTWVRQVTIAVDQPEDVPQRYLDEPIYIERQVSPQWD